MDVLCARLRKVCAQTRPLLDDGPAAEAVDLVQQRLDEQTLRVAVGGRVNAGKSTLVNALLGQRLAASAATECTLLVAWFRGSHQNRVEVHRYDGRVYRVPGSPGGGLPADLAELGSPREEIAEVVVEVTNARLADYTLIDTPGMDSLSGLDEMAMAALGRADALLYVTPHPGEGDVEALEALRRNAEAQGVTAINVLGVLSRIDELGTGVDDPWPDARRLAQRYGSKLTGVAARVVPVAGLLAQTAMGDEYSDTETHLLLRLASTDPLDLEDALFSHDAFLTWDECPLNHAERARLLKLLGRYGVAAGVEAVRNGTTSTADLLVLFRQLSGIEDLLEHIRTHFVAAADRLRANSAIRVLEEATWKGRTPGEEAVLSTLRARLAEIRRHPHLRQADLAPLLNALASGRLPLPEDDSAALLRLATGLHAADCFGLPPGTDSRTLAKAIDAEIARWQRLEWSHSRAVQRCAHLARELCEAFFFEL